MADTWVRYNLANTYWEYSVNLGATWARLREDCLHGIADFIAGVTIGVPAAGTTRLFSLSDRKLYVKDNNSIVSGSFPQEQTARIYNNANLVCATGVWTALTFNTERWDTEGLHSGVSNTGRLTIPEDGRYIVGFQALMDPNITGTVRAAGISKNGVVGVGILIGVQYLPPILGGVFETPLNVVTLHDFIAGDYVLASIFQDSGGNLNAKFAGNTSPEFWAHRLS